jgi:hypothetical protein
MIALGFFTTKDRFISDIFITDYDFFFTTAETTEIITLDIIFLY